MAKYKIKYWDLGRTKAEGEFIVDDHGNIGNVNARMNVEFSKHLMSRSIAFEDGFIFAGVHTVGKYSVEELETNQGYKCKLCGRAHTGKERLLDDIKICEACYEEQVFKNI